MSRIRTIIAAALLIGACGPAGAEMYKGYETPDYAVERRETLPEGTVEIRDYRAGTVAEVTVPGSRSGARGAGFRKLAGYIFGGNAAGDKIAMTTPVTQMAAPDGGWTVRFAMPADRAASLPAPRDATVRFATTGPVRRLVLEFGGIPFEGRIDRRIAAVRAFAAAQGLAVDGAPVLMFYDPPFALPWTRRNEVALTLR